MGISGVSPFAVGHTLLAVVAASALLVVFATVILGDRHRGGIAALLVLVALAAGDARAVLLVGIAFSLLLVERYALKDGRRLLDWPGIGTLASRIAVILALAVAIQAFQLGTYGLVWRAITYETALAAYLAPSSTRPTQIST